jgi:hypothetical protein
MKGGYISWVKPQNRVEIGDGDFKVLHLYVCHTSDQVGGDICLIEFSGLIGIFLWRDRIVACSSKQRLDLRRRR